LAASALAGALAPSLAAELIPIDVAYAGSMGSVMEGPIKSAVAADLGFDLRGRALEATALANLIAGGSIRPDVFIAITQDPIFTILRAGKANSAEPIARTEMVIAYSPKSRFAAQFDRARRGQAEWWMVLQQPGLRFGRTDPLTDPQGRNIVFTMMLAAKLYRRPRLLDQVLGPVINPRQIFSESSVLSRLQSGQLDACSSYKIQPGPFDLPYVSLPAQVNLSSRDVGEENPEVKLTVGGQTYRPEPLVFYAAALADSSNPKGASAFVQWLKNSEAQSIFRRYQYDPPGRASTLRA
jgi:molybdate/tungstate transport system substrate-binding protein